MRVRFAFGGGEHTWDTGRSSAWKLSDGICEEFFSLPKVIELVVPTPFLKPTAVDCADAIVDAVDTDFIGPESYDVAVLDVGGMYGSVFLVSVSF